MIQILNESANERPNEKIYFLNERCIRSAGLKSISIIRIKMSNKRIHLKVREERN